MSKTKSILVTGGAGFIGSNFIVFFLEKYKNIKVVNLDKLTYAGELSNLTELEDNANYTFIKGDITDELFIENLFQKYNLLFQLFGYPPHLRVKSFSGNE